jgi:hypothetical protein
MRVARGDEVAVRGGVVKTVLRDGVCLNANDSQLLSWHQPRLMGVRFHRADCERTSLHPNYADGREILG